VETPVSVAALRRKAEESGLLFSSDDSMGELLAVLAAAVPANGSCSGFNTATVAQRKLAATSVAVSSSWSPLGITVFSACQAAWRAWKAGESRKSWARLSGGSRRRTDSFSGRDT
jgi:hypothetical protein